MKHKAQLACSVLTSLLFASCTQAPTPETAKSDASMLKGDDPSVFQQRGQPIRLGSQSIGLQSSNTPVSSIKYLPQAAAPFGPKTYTRQTGAPQTISDTFSAEAGSSLITFDVQGVSAGEVVLNGAPLLTPSDFNGHNAKLERQVTLAKKNTLTVNLAGTPGTSLTVTTQAARPAPLTGRLVDASGQPLAGLVTVQFIEGGQTATAQVDASGVFSFDTLPSTGKFIVSGESADLYGSLSGALSAKTGQAQVQLVLNPQGNSIVRGTVRSESGAPVPNALVTLSFAERPLTKTVVSDANGTYVVDQLPNYGSLAVTAYDPVTSVSATKFSYLVYAGQTQAVDLVVKPMPIVQPGFANGNFSEGTLSNWNTEGDVQLAPRSTYFPAGTARNFTAQNAEPQAAVVSSADSYRVQGTLSKTFKPTSCDTDLKGQVRFLSNEYPTWYGTQYNDSYMVTLTTPYGVQTLASGNLNSSAWQGGLGGYSGATPVIPINIDLTQFPQDDGPLPMTLSMSVSDVGDSIIDSAVAVTDFRLETDPNKVQLRNVDQLKMKAPEVGTWVVGNDEIPAGVQTPYTTKTEQGLIVVARERDVVGGKIAFNMPVEVQGFDPEKHCNAEAYFPELESQPTRITGSTLEIPVKYPVGGDVVLASVAVESAGGVAAASTGLRAQSVETPQYVALVSATGAGKPTIKSIPRRYWDAFRKWFDEADWETTKFYLGLGWDLIPIVGDGTEIVKQTVNFATGRGADPVVATLAGIGLGLDLIPTPATEAGGAAVSATRTIYKLSKTGKGLLADAIEVTVLKVKNGQITGEQALEILKGYLGTYWDLLKLGVKNVEWAETVGIEVGKHMTDGTNPVTAVKLMGNGVKNLQKYVSDVPRALGDMAATAHLPGAFGNNSPFRRVLNPKADETLVRGAMGEIHHAQNLIQGGARNVEFPGEISAGGFLADVDVRSILPNGRTAFDDAKLNLTGVSSSAKTQAQRLCEVAKASGGALARWVVEGAVDMDAVYTIEGRGVMVVNAAGQRVGTRPDLTERQVTCGK
ncbi:hypothetical protein GCM10008959_36550 [Deinococcus seoulensis]|uniref:Carboxypeptidase regulatory-like domain-containing protein n=1 Tax=Deinococcus seoulensis TaxID=1837379 RepID=A0ABQ2RX65_9DEIO|nr:carboxypeptidase-like regulatory domain-containing protein [Deinococcus seoulensis]GGR71534.1 hypothetical protein GCM10008959_36550 [Deinococcus seoulensis]